MSTRRRTIPRSAARLKTAEKAQNEHTNLKSEVYAPQFSARQATGGLSEDVTDVRGLSQESVVGDVEAGALEPVVTFLERPLQKTRWITKLRRGKSAVLAVGSGEDRGGKGAVGLFEIERDGGRLKVTEFESWESEGSVMDMQEWDHGTIVVGGTDGKVRIGRLNGMEMGDREGDFKMMDAVGKIGEKKIKEGVAGVACGVSDGIVAVGSEGGMVVLDGRGNTLWSTRGMDAVGFRGVAKVGMGSGSEFVTAGGSGIVGLWDARTARETKRCIQTLRHPIPGTRPICVTVDAAQPQYILAGTAAGQVAIWDRRGGDGFPLCRVELHESFIWEIHVASASRPGLLLTCGEDASVWMLDFASAASKGAGKADSRSVASGSTDIWRAKLAQSDIRDISLEIGATLGVNSVDYHGESGLVSYVSDSGTVTVTS